MLVLSGILIRFHFYIFALFKFYHFKLLIFFFFFTAGLINPNNLHILTHFGEFLLYLDIPEYFAFITLRIIDRFNHFASI